MTDNVSSQATNNKPKTTAWHSEAIKPHNGGNRRFDNAPKPVADDPNKPAQIMFKGEYTAPNRANNAQGNHQNNRPRSNNREPMRQGPSTAGIPSVRNKLRVIPLGGFGEIGINMTAFEYNDTIVIFDAGSMFPDNYMFGIDYMIPNTLYLKDRKDKIKALLITHGHEDHIGAIPYVIRDLDAPIYAPVFAKGLIEFKLEEHGLTNSVKLNSIKPGDKLRFGDIEIEPFHVTHSIPDAVGFSVKTPTSRVVWLTDWKFDETPVSGKVFDRESIAKWSKEGIDVLFSESTNVERPGRSISELAVGESLKKTFSEAKGRIILATFASQIHRVHQVVQAAVATNRKIAFSGRSMIRNAEMAIKMGYINVPRDSVISLSQARSIPPEKLLIVSTGSQGEEMSSLFRMAHGSHKQFRIKKGDTVVLSASPIPGNEAAIGDVINSLFKLGAHVVYGKEIDIHVTGHAYRDELAELIKLANPKNFVPIHGEYRHLALHADLAVAMGVPEKNVTVMENGEILEIDGDKAIKTDWRAPVESVMVDGLGIGDVGNIVLRDRQAMATDGIFVCILTIDRTSKDILTSPDIISRGFVYMRAAEDLIHRSRSEIRRVFRHGLEQYEREIAGGDWSGVKSAIRDRLGDFLFQETKRSPMVIPVIIPI